MPMSNSFDHLARQFGCFARLFLGVRRGRFRGYFTASAASTTARSAAFTASELPKRANSSSSTIATAKNRRALSTYLPRESRLALEKLTSGISRSERLIGSFYFRISSPLVFRGSSGTDDPDDTARHALREDDEHRPAELRLADADRTHR
jgi:hypothetical protein